MKTIGKILLTVLVLSFLTAAAVSVSAYEVASGVCGANLTWTLDDAGTLTISGTGEMWDFKDYAATWYGYNLSITSIVIEQGVTSVGAQAFYWYYDYLDVYVNYSRVTSISIAESVKSVGDRAFYDCSNLTRLYIYDIDYVSKNAFRIEQYFIDGLNIYYCGCSDWDESNWCNCNTWWEYDGKIKDLITIYYPIYNSFGTYLWVNESEVNGYIANGGKRRADVTTLLYAEDGRTIRVMNSEVPAYTAVGWYTEPFVTVYAMDGRTLSIPTSTLDAYLAVGWYADQSEIYTTVYSPDGSTLEIMKNDIPAYAAVGWYTVPVTTVYALDGRTLVIPESDVSAYLAVGWYKNYYDTVTRLCAYDSTSASHVKYITVFKAEVPAWVAVGWSENYVDLLTTVYGFTGFNDEISELRVYKARLQSFLNYGFYTSLDALVDAYVRAKEYEYILNALSNGYYKYLENSAEEVLVTMKNNRSSNSNTKYYVQGDWYYTSLDVDGSQRKRVLKTLYNGKGSPLVSLGYDITYSNGTPEVSIKFINAGSKIITAFELEFNCYDAYGSATSDYSWASSKISGYTDNANMKSGEIETFTWTLDENKRTKTIKNLIIKRVAFSDGTTWKR